MIIYLKHSPLILKLLITASVIVIAAAMCASCSDASPADSVAVTPTTSPLLPAPSLAMPANPIERPAVPAFVSVDIVGSGDESASFQRPAYVAAEIVGRDISNVSLIGGSVADDGTRRVMIYRPIDPDLGDEEWPGNWTDGVHEIIQTWDFGGDFLFDGRNGDFVMLWTTDPQSETRTVHGRFRSSGVDDYANAVLTVNTTSGAVEDLIETETGMSLAFEAGDEFQLANLILADDYSLHSEPGISLFFDDGAQLAYTSRPDRSGNYFLGVSAESAGGDSNMTLVDFRVDNDALNPGHRTYFDPHRGIQFQYPESWKGSIDRQGLLAFNDPSGTTSMSISTHPDMSGRPAVDLKNMALETYGSVTVLYEDQVEIGQGGGLRTVYGYESAGGSRTGVMLTFSQDGQPFLIDIDGPSSDEAATLELAGVVAGSWDSRPVVASDSGRWVEIVVDGLGVAAPADYSHSHMGNGWHRFAGPTDQIFIAFRAEPVTDPGLSRRMEYWTEVARRNVDDFAGSPLRTVRRGDREWARVDIEYRLETGDMVAGVIMSSKFGDGELVIWGEAPADQYPQIEAEVLMVAVDELSHAAPPQPDSARSP